MKSIRKTYLVALAILLSPVASNADLVYSQGNINTTDRGAYQYFGQELADDFTALATGTITNATWTGQYYGSDNNTGTESFTINLFAGGGSVPGSLLFSIVGIANIVASATANYFDYSMDIAGPAVTAGTSYWISIYSNESAQNYSWANSDDGSANGAVRNSGGSWRALNDNMRSNHVFALNTAVNVPEPGIVALLGLGLAGIGFSKRKKA